MTADKKILVAYYSKTGNTERVAKEIAVRLGADIEKITDLKKRSGILGYIFGGRDAMKKRPTEIGELQKNPAEYDLIIMGSPVWSWNATPAITTYINKTRGRIKNAAFFNIRKYRARKNCALFGRNFRKKSNFFCRI